MRIQVFVFTVLLGIASGLPGQTPTVNASLTGKVTSKAFSMPRMSDGHPDLQGTYDLATLTPIDRPPVKVRL